MKLVDDSFAEFPDGPTFGDFWIVTGQFGRFHISAAVAATIECALDRRWPPRWLTLDDLVGSRVRVRTRRIEMLFESTVAQRSYERDLERARRLEESADRRPGESDN